MKPSTLIESYDKIRNDLRVFIDLSLKEDEKSWEEWINSLPSGSGPQCWLRKDCEEPDCPAYQNTFGRCWLIAGTMCGGGPSGRFAKKYTSCRECDVYQETVFQDAKTEIDEHLIVLVHSLRTRQRELRDLATTDFLTGLYNRRYFNIIIDREIERVKRAEGHLILMMIDVDEFKAMNDSRGHLYGDKMLQECAAILRDATRGADLVIRYGGDEFLVILSDSGMEQAETIISRIRHRLDQVNRCRNTGDLPLSLSIGVSIYDGECSLDEAMHLADNRMYADKQRNKRTRKEQLISID